MPSNRTRLRRCDLVVAALPGLAEACSWSVMDPVVPYDDSGIWNPTVYRGIVGGASLVGLTGAIWEGSETRLGKTMWAGAEGEVIAGVTSSIGKHVFTRARPSQGGDPCLWFQGGAHYSFPNGEAAAAAALVTPYMIEYGNDQPAVYALALVPLYMGAGRIKNQAHWQSDVAVGWAIGGLSGWFTHTLEVPITIQLLPHGAALGLQSQF